MPHQSIYPLVASVGILIAAFAASGLDSNPEPGMHIKLALAIFGGVIMLAGIFLWSLEGAEGYHLHLDKDGKPIEDSHGAHH
jgi:cytochrome c oxidase subunit 1